MEFTPKSVRLVYDGFVTAASARSLYQEHTLNAVAEILKGMTEAKHAAQDAEMREDYSAASPEYWQFICCGKDARNMLMNLLDSEAVKGDATQSAMLQTIVDELTNYVRGYMKLEDEEDQAEQAANLTYAEEDADMGEMEAAGVDDLASSNYTNKATTLSSPLSPAQRKRHATIVRTDPKTGTKQYKYPIPDKAHARAALARINQSDLTPAEKDKVQKRAHKVLGAAMKEGEFMDPDEAFEETQDPALVNTQTLANNTAHTFNQNIGATTGTTSSTGYVSFSPMQYSLTQESQVVTLSSVEDGLIVSLREAQIDLAKNEVVATILQPGFNKSGQRYYKTEAIKEGIGLFKGLKMFYNHASQQELAQRPERDLKDWVATIKESWVGQNGEAKARIKVVRRWFGDFLKELQEADALGEIGLSIFATGSTVPSTIDGKRTLAVEKFQRAFSVDWVTEPGAGGRIEEIWESYLPLKAAEAEEYEVLQEMSASEVLAALKKDRADVLDLLAQESEQNKAHNEEIAEAAAKVAELETELAALKESLEKAEENLVAIKTAELKAKQSLHISEILSKTELVDTAKMRLAKEADRELHLTEAADLDVDAVTNVINGLIDAEKEYVALLMKEARPAGVEIKGMGSTQAGNEEHAATASHDDVARRIAARWGHKEEAV